VDVHLETNKAVPEEIEAVVNLENNKAVPEEIETVVH